MSRLNPTSSDNDGGTSRRRPKRRAAASAPTTSRVVPKSYSGRLPISGQHPPRLTKFERERDERKRAA